MIYYFPKKEKINNYVLRFSCLQFILVGEFNKAVRWIQHFQIPQIHVHVFLFTLYGTFPFLLWIYSWEKHWRKGWVARSMFTVTQKCACVISGCPHSSRQETVLLQLIFLINPWCFAEQNNYRSYLLFPLILSNDLGQWARRSLIEKPKRP